jgi:DNA recombination protein RmuC
VQRPDMVVRLPNDREIVIDAKANVQAYVEAIETEDVEAREEQLGKFAGHVVDQVGKLGGKAYWEQFERAPEFVIMFVPGDQFVDAVLSRRPNLVEEAAAKRVILASPSTLIGLLRAVELGWREQRLAEAFEELRREGATLLDRFRVALEHVDQMGSHLEKSVEHYNRFVASYERNLEPTLRKFEDAGLKSAKPLPELKPLEAAPMLQSLLGFGGEDAPALNAGTGTGPKGKPKS